MGVLAPATDLDRARAGVAVHRLFDLVFIVVTVNTALQGPTLASAARRLQVIAPAEPLDIDVEAAPLEALHADLLQLHGVEIFELRLPAQANLTLIVRDSPGGGHGGAWRPAWRVRGRARRRGKGHVVKVHDLGGGADAGGVRRARW